MEKRYDGSLFPISVRIVNQEEPEREQWLELPTTQQTLRELLQNIGGDRQGWYLGEVDCHLYNAAAVEDCTDINELNYLAAGLEALTDAEFGSYQVIVDTDRHCDTIQDLINLTENLDCYDIAPNIQDYEDLAQYEGLYDFPCVYFPTGIRRERLDFAHSLSRTQNGRTAFRFVRLAVRPLFSYSRLDRISGRHSR